MTFPYIYIFFVRRQYVLIGFRGFRQVFEIASFLCFLEFTLIVLISNLHGLTSCYCSHVLEILNLELRITSWNGDDRNDIKFDHIFRDVVPVFEREARVKFSS